MIDIEKLLIEKYSLEKEIKRLKSIRSDLFYKCTGYDQEHDFCEYIDKEQQYTCCSDAVIKNLEAINKDNYPDGYSFDEIFFDVACDPCVESRNIKLDQLLPAKNKLRAIKSSLTKISRRLYKCNR